MAFSARIGQPICPELPSIEGKPIIPTNTHRHLGITLSSTLEWGPHIQDVIARAKRRAGLLRWMSHDLPDDVAASLYLLYVRPTMEYAAPVWHGSLRQEDAMALERIQAAVARRLLRAPWMAPKAQLLEQLDWPALRWRREVASMLLLHQLLHDRTTPLAKCTFPFASSMSDRNRRKPFQLVLGTTCTTRYLRSFFYRSSLLWNTLPHAIQSLTGRKKFQQALELHWQAHRYNTKRDIPFQ